MGASLGLVSGGFAGAGQNGIRWNWLMGASLWWKVERFRVPR